MASEDTALNYRKMKQKYLKEQIKANKWDPNDFAAHLAIQRNNGKLTKALISILGNSKS